MNDDLTVHLESILPQVAVYNKNIASKLSNTFLTSVVPFPIPLSLNPDLSCYNIIALSGTSSFLLQAHQGDFMNYGSVCSFYRAKGSSCGFDLPSYST